MRLNVRSRTKDTEEEQRDTGTQWQEWKLLQTSSRPSLHSRPASLHLLASINPVSEEDQADHILNQKTPIGSPQIGLSNTWAGPGHKHTPSRTPSNELYLHHHATRDSMVDNLLSTFEMLPEGSVTYPSQVPSVPSVSTFTTRPGTPNTLTPTISHTQETHTGQADRSTAESRNSEERFDPYTIRSTPIRQAPKSSANATKKQGLFSSKMSTPRTGASPSASRPLSAVNPGHGNRKSKGSSKSIDMTTVINAPSGITSHGQTRAPVQEAAVSEKALRRRSRTLGNGNTSSSILDRARPVPGDYHDFYGSSAAHGESQRKHSPAAISDRPTIYHRGSEGQANDENLKPQISTRNKVAGLTGSDRIPTSSRQTAQNSQESTAWPSRQPSMQVLNANPERSVASSPNLMRHQPSMESSKSRAGFFRRVFGSSKPSTPQPSTPTYQLPPLSTTTGTMLSTTTSASQDDTSKVSSYAQRPSKTFDETMPPPPVPASRETPHVIQKKASFFRRRKKSMSDNLAVETRLADERPKEMLPATPSASSLQQAMDPFFHQQRHDDFTGIPPIVSPVETLFHESREQQSSDGTESVFRFGPGATRSSDQVPRVEMGRQPQGSGSMSSRQDSINTFDLGATIRGPHATIGVPDPPIPWAADTFETGAVRTGPAPLSAIAASTRGTGQLSNALQAHNSNSTMRIASTTAQVTGNTLLDHRSEEDWVDTTPFKRPIARDTLAKATRVRLDEDAEPQTINRERSPSAPDTSLAASLRPTVASSISAQSVPKVKLGHGAAAQSVDLSIATLVVSPDDRDLARKLYEEHDDPQVQLNASTVLGTLNKEGLRHVYMSMFDFGGINILVSFRDLCKRLALRGETQQVDRIIASFASRWCDCNPSHGFESLDIVHTICYSILLLNTDLHVANVENKMTRQQFIKNTLATVSTLVQSDPSSRFATSQPSGSRSPLPWRDARSPSPTIDSRPSFDGRRGARSAARPISGVSGAPNFTSPSPFDGRPVNPADLLVNSSVDDLKTWMNHLATVLREFYVHIRATRLPLHSAAELQLQDQASSNNLHVNTGNLLRRAGSVASSKNGPDAGRRGTDFKTAPNTWNTRSRSKQKMLYHSSTFGSSTTSFEDTPIFSPSASSTWSRSLRAPTAMSSDSLNSAFTQADYGLAPSIGFASALSNAIIREEEGPLDDDPDAVPAIEDESLELEGAPWAKEGMVHHKHHLEATDKRAHNRNWTQCFAVIEKGRMRLFSFTSNKSIKKKSNKGTAPGAVVGGGNWMDNAEELLSITLRQTLANELPPPGYNKQRPHVFALMLPGGGLHLFHVGTKEIATEFVSTANYWAARLSKEPLVGGVSNIEYGWSENILDAALFPNSRGESRPPSSARIHSPTSSTSGHIPSRPSISGSLRGASIDLSGRGTQRMPGDRVALSDWVPPQQVLGRSGLREVTQLDALRKYVGDVEADLRAHNELRGPLDIAFSRRHPNHAKAMQNWERKSSYLLREIVKYRTYTDALVAAQDAKEKVYEDRSERKRIVDL